MTLKQWICGVIGHRFVLSFDPPKLALYCVDCKYTTVGLSTDLERETGDARQSHKSSAEFRPVQERQNIGTKGNSDLTGHG